MKGDHCNELLFTTVGGMLEIDRFAVLSISSTWGRGTTTSNDRLESLGDHFYFLLNWIVWGGVMGEVLMLRILQQFVNTNCLGLIILIK